jgi:hypothetical protein
MTTPSQAPLVTLGLMTLDSSNATEWRWLEALVDDLRRQTFKDWELIINVNGGKETRGDDLARLTQGLPLRAVFRQRAPQLGLENQRSLFQMSRGRYFAWLADHDRYPPTALEKLVGLLEAQPGTVLAYGRTQLIGANDEPVSVYDDHLDTRGLGPAERGVKTATTLVSCNQFYGLWRAEALEKIDFLVYSRGHDHLWLLQAALLGDIVQLPEVLFLRRQNRKLSFEEAEARMVEFGFRAEHEMLKRIPWCHLAWMHLVLVERLLPAEQRRAAQSTILEHFFTRFGNLLVGEIQRFQQFASSVADGTLQLSLPLGPQFHHANAIVATLSEAVGIAPSGA